MSLHVKHGPSGMPACQRIGNSKKLKNIPSIRSDANTRAHLTKDTSLLIYGHIEVRDAGKRDCCSKTAGTPPYDGHFELRQLINSHGYYR